MARMNIYLPDELAAAAKEADLNVSALAQDAIRDALQRHALVEWFESIPPMKNPPSRAAVQRALDEGREDLGL